MKPQKHKQPGVARRRERLRHQVQNDMPNTNAPPKDSTIGRLSMPRCPSKTNAAPPNNVVRKKTSAVRALARESYDLRNSRPSDIDLNWASTC